MHIAYLHQYFATPAGKTGTRSYEFAKRWTQAGIDVTVITSRAQLSEDELVRAELVKNGLRRIVIDGIEVLIVEADYQQTMSYSARIKSFMQFSIASSKVLLKLKNIDLVYATSTPLTIAIPAIVKYKLHKVPFIFEVRDLWPLVPISLGVIKNPIAKKMLLSFERYIYKQAKGIVALSPDMKTYIDKITGSPAKTIVAPNCADIDLFKPTSPDKRSELREKLSWSDKFVIVHSGAMGKVNGLYRIIPHARWLQDEFGDKIIFVLVGEGKEKHRLTGLVEQYDLHNIVFMAPLPKRQLAELLPAADAGLVSVDRIKELEYNSANKLFDYLAPGLPVLLNYGGWQKELLEESNAGLGIENFDEDEFKRNIIKLYENYNLRETMGKNARQLAQSKFSRDLIAERIRKFIKKKC